MDSAISFALEKFISGNPPKSSMPPRRAAPAKHESAPLSPPMRQTSTRADATTRPGAPTLVPTPGGAKRTASASPPQVVAASTPRPVVQPAPIAKRRSASPPKRTPPPHLLPAEHMASSGQGCRAVLAVPQGLTHGDVSRNAMWTTPRGQDVTGVFRLLQRPTVHTALDGDRNAVESYTDLVVTLATERTAPSDEGDGTTPVALRSFVVSTSNHPKQGFVRVFRAVHPAPCQAADHQHPADGGGGDEVQYRAVVAGTLVGEYVKVDAVNEDPLRMTRFSLVALSQATTCTTRVVARKQEVDGGGSTNPPADEEGSATDDNDSSIDTPRQALGVPKAHPNVVAPAAPATAGKSAAAQHKSNPGVHDTAGTEAATAVVQPSLPSTEGDGGAMLQHDVADRMSSPQGPAPAEEQSVDAERLTPSVQTPPTHRHRRGVDTHPPPRDRTSTSTLRDVITQFTKQRCIESTASAMRRDDEDPADAATQREARHTAQRPTSRQAIRTAAPPAARLRDEDLLRQALDGTSLQPLSRSVNVCVLVAADVDASLLELASAGTREALASCDIAFVAGGGGNGDDSTLSPSPPSTRAAAAHCVSESFALVPFLRSPSAVVGLSLAVVCRSIAALQHALAYLAPTTSHPDHSGNPRDDAAVEAPPPPRLRLILDECDGFFAIASQLHPFATAHPILLYRTLRRESVATWSLSSSWHGLDVRTLTDDGVGAAAAHTHRVIERIGDRAHHPWDSVVRATVHVSRHLGCLGWASDSQRACPRVYIGEDHPLRYARHVDAYVGGEGLRAGMQWMDVRVPFVLVQDGDGWEQAVLHCLTQARRREWHVVCVHLPADVVVSANTFDAWMDTIAMWTPSHPRTLLLTAAHGRQAFPSACLEGFVAIDEAPSF